MIPVTVDTTVIASGGREVVPLLQRGALVIVIDGNASRPFGLGKRCQAGHEYYARLLDVSQKRELYAKLVESCHKPVMSGSPPLTVQADGRIATLRSWYAFARWTPQYAEREGSVTFDLISGPPFTITLADNGTFTVKP